MAKLLLNADGKVLTSNDKVLKAPEGVNVMKALLDGRKSADYLFQKYNGESIGNLIKYEDTENIESMRSVFAGCSNLQSVPLLNTSKVTNMSSIFQGCSSLQEIPQFDTSNVTNMVNFLNQCSSLQTTHQINTDKVSDIRSMFDSCFKLKKVDITTLDKVTSTTNISLFARWCYSLTKLIIRTMTVIPPLNTNSFNSCCHFTGTFDATYNPDSLKDGRIYVPDNMVDQLKQATNWSAYADIIVPLSTLQEE